MSDLTPLVILLLLAFFIRGWVLVTAVVPARDSIGFIRQALAFEKQHFTDVVQAAHQHPGYPLGILITSWPIRYVHGTTDWWAMQLSAQLVSSVAGWLLVIPMFYIGKELFSARIGFWSALLFQCLPASGHVLSDAISDPLHMLFAAMSLFWGIRAVRHNSWRPFALAGGFAGLAYLVRPEGVAIAVATGAVLLGSQLVTQWRRPWRKVLVCGGTLAAATLIVGSPYYLVTGTFTNKPSAQKLTKLAGITEATNLKCVESRRSLHKRSQNDAFITHETKAGHSASRPHHSRGPLFAVHVRDWENQSSIRRMVSGLKAIITEYIHATLYILWLPTLLGLWFCRDRYCKIPGAWVCVILFVGQGFLVWRLATVAGYVSDRHILLLVLCSLQQAVVVILMLGQGLQNLVARTTVLPSRWRLAATKWSVSMTPKVGGGILTVLMILALVRTLRPLHEHREGHYAAGEWLRDHTDPSDKIHDDHCWAHYYAGRVLLEGKRPRPPKGHALRKYLVISRKSKRRPPSTPRTFTEKKAQRLGGRVVFQWPRNGPVSRAKVVVYELPRS